MEYTAYFDVDDTLIVDVFNHSCDDCIHIDGLSFHRHDVHIDCMRQHKAEGHQVVVWSQAGQSWAKEVVAALGIEDLVDYILSKPSKYYDDIQNPREFMGEHVFHFQKIIGD